MNIIVSCQAIVSDVKNNIELRKRTLKDGRC